MVGQGTARYSRAQSGIARYSQVQCLKDPSCAIYFWKSRCFEDIKLQKQGEKILEIMTFCRSLFLDTFELGKCVETSVGTLQLNNLRLIGCLISFNRSAGFNRSRYIGSAGEAQI